MTITRKFQIGLLCVGAVLLFTGGRELMLCTKASPTPRTISYQQLAAQGYGRNAHIILTDAVPVTEWMVYNGTGDNGPWTRVYFPAIANDNPWIEEVEAKVQAGRNITTMPKDIRVLLKFTGVKNVKDLETKLLAQYERNGGIHGTIINEIDSLGAKEKSLLQQGYTSLDVNKVLILEADRTPSKTKGLALVGGGIVGVVLGGLWLLTSYRQSRQTRVASIPPAPLPRNDQSQRERDETQLAQFSRDEEQLNR